MVTPIMKKINLLKNIPPMKHIRRGITSLISTDVNNISGIATVSFRKPPVNTLNTEILEEISSTLSSLEKEKVKGLILTSSKDGIFSGGLDLNEIYPQTDQDRMKRYWALVRQTWMKLYSSTYPTVAVINGHSPAGGCLFATACEYRVMTKGYRIGGNETLVGLVAPVWFMDRMRDLIGNRQTELAFTTGQLFTTEEALAIGLVDEIVENKDEGIAKAEAFIKKFEKIPSLARSLTKTEIRKEMLEKMIRDEEFDTDHFVRHNTQPDIQKIIGDYIEGMKKKSKTKQ